MGAVSLLAIPAAFCGFGVVLYGLFARRPSTLVGVVASLIGLLTACGSYSGFVEAHSTTWGVGYAAVALASAIVGLMHFWSHRMRDPTSVSAENQRGTTVDRQLQKGDGIV